MNADAMGAARRQCLTLHMMVHAACTAVTWLTVMKKRLNCLPLCVTWLTVTLLIHMTAAFIVHSTKQMNGTNLLAFGNVHSHSRKEIPMNQSLIDMMNEELDKQKPCTVVYTVTGTSNAFKRLARMLLSAERLCEEGIRQAYRDLVSNTDYLESGPATDPSVAYFKGQRCGFYMGMSTMQSRILGPAPAEEERGHE